jgi:hypothetical protein
VSDPERLVENPSPSARELRRLGKNHSGYHGETIDINAVLGECDAAGHRHGWEIEQLPVAAGLNLRAFTREGARPPNTSAPASRVRFYMSTGIHGDEPAGPLAVRQLLLDNHWPEGFDLWLCPCLNPYGFLLNRRENRAGVDLNRDYLAPKAPETVAHIAWLQRQPTFDLCLCLHEDWEAHGFYVYELNPDQRPSVAEPIIDGVAAVCPIDQSELIEGRAATGGIIRPNLDPRSRPQWPEAFFLLSYKTRLSYTLEAPSDFPLSARVAALVHGVEAAVRECARVAATAATRRPSG